MITEDQDPIKRILARQASSQPKASTASPAGDPIKRIIDANAATARARQTATSARQRVAADHEANPVPQPPLLQPGLQQIGADVVAGDPSPFQPKPQRSGGIIDEVKRGFNTFMQGLAVDDARTRVGGQDPRYDDTSGYGVGVEGDIGRMLFDAARGRMKSGQELSKEATRDVQDAAALQRRNAEMPRHPAARAMEEAAARGDVGGVVRSVAEGGITKIPGNLAAVAGGQLAQQPDGVLRSVSLGPMGLPGEILGGYLAALNTEARAAIMDELHESSIDLEDAESVKRALGDPAFLERVSDRTMKRTGAIGSVDALANVATGGLARIPSRVARKTAGMALQTTGEMGGEALAQLVTEGEVYPAEVVQEGIAGLGQSAIETGAFQSGRTPVEQARAQRGKEEIVQAPITGSVNADEVLTSPVPAEPELPAITVEEERSMARQQFGLPMPTVKTPEPSPAVESGAPVSREAAPKDQAQHGPLAAEPRPRPSADRVIQNNAPTDLSTYADTMYRETNLDAAAELLTTFTDMSLKDVYLSNTQDLATGQGENTGVMLEFDPKGLQGTVNTAKPGWDQAYDRGAGEFVARLNDQRKYAEAIRSITVRPGAKGRKAMDRRLRGFLEQQGWAKATNDDASVTYTRPAPSSETQPARVVSELEPETKIADHATEPQFQTPADYYQHIAEKGTDPAEIEQAYRTASSELAFSDPVVEAVLSLKKPLLRTDVQSNRLIEDPKLESKWLADDGIGVDQAIIQVREQTGVELSPDELLDIVEKYPAKKQPDHPVVAALQSRYQQVTGKRIPKRKAQRIPSLAGADVPFQTTRELASPDRGMPELAAPSQQPQGRIEVAPIAGGKPKPLKQIKLDLEKAVGRKVRTAKTRAGASGTYFPGSARTVVRFEGDLDTTAHEVAHALDDQYGIVADWVNEQRAPFESELIPRFSSQGSTEQTGPRSERPYKLAEGVAEYIRAWIVNPQAAEQAAPKFTQVFKDKVPPEVLTALESFGTDVRTWAGAPAESRTVSNVEMDLKPKRIVERIRETVTSEKTGDFQITWADKLNAEVVDALAPVWKAYEYGKRLKGVEHVLPENDLRILARNYAGVDMKLSTVFEHGPLTARGDHVKDMGGLPWLFEPLDTSSKQSLEKDFEGVVSLLINERVIEKSDQLQKAADDILKSVGKQQDALTKMEALRLEIAKARKDLEHMKLQRKRDGSIPKQEAAVSELKKKLASAQLEYKAAKADEADARQTLGYKGRPDGAKAYATQRSQRLVGTGAGVYADDKQARQALDELQTNPERYERLRAAADRYRQWANANLKYLKDKGRISEQAYQAITSRNEQYVALQRIHEEIDPKGFRASGKHLGKIRQTIQRFKGSTRQIQNPYVSLIMQTEAMVKEADRNEALRSFRDVLVSDRKMYEGSPINFDAIGSRAKSNDKDAIAIYVDGKAEYWQFQEDIHRALKGMGEHVSYPAFVKALRTVLVDVPRTFITHSPPFLVRNLLRDPLQRAVLSNSGSKPWGHAYYITHPEDFNKDLEALHRYGGGMFGFYSGGREAYYGRLRDAMKKAAGRSDTVISLPSRMAKGYGRMAKTTEDAGRLAEFRKAKDEAKKRGMDEYNASLYAAFEARDLMDYAVAGRTVKHINQWVMFSNAAVQGMAKTLRTGYDAPKRTITRWLFYIASLELFNYAWNAFRSDDEDEELRQQPSYIRDMFWNYKLAPNLWLRIPKPWEMGAVASALSRGIDAVRGKENPFEGYWKNAFGAVVPLNEDAVLGPMKLPAEVMMNYDVFKKRQIIPVWDAGLELELRKGTDKASRIGKLGQYLLGIDARMVDHVIDGEFGGVGKMARDISDLGREDKDTLPRLVVSTSGVLIQSPAYAAKDVQWLLDYYKKKGLERTKEATQLREWLGEYNSALSWKEKDRIAREIREYASSVRKSYDD